MLIATLLQLYCDVAVTFLQNNYTFILYFYTFIKHFLLLKIRSMQRFCKVAVKSFPCQSGWRRVYHKILESFWNNSLVSVYHLCLQNPFQIAVTTWQQRCWLVVLTSRQLHYCDVICIPMFIKVAQSYSSSFAAKLLFRCCNDVGDAATVRQHCCNGTATSLACQFRREAAQRCSGNIATTLLLSCRSVTAPLLSVDADSRWHSELRIANYKINLEI